MDLDLSTNGACIKENISKLNAGKISWMILGYSENCTLNVNETGDNSLEDMFDEFQGSEIMYGFASVIDPNTKLKKNIYIHWQGAGSKQVMKTKSVQHSNVIRELCKPIHVTLNARDPQDLDLNEVMQKVAAASGANYSFHTEKQQIFETKPSIQSQNNSAYAIREERQKELASLGGIKKEISTNQKFNSPPVISKPAIKPPMNNKPNYSKVGTNYEKINPEKEFQSLQLNKKSTFETPARIQSENNTAEKAREERQKELSKLANRVYVEEPFQQVGTNYTKINPSAEIQHLKRQSSNFDSEVPNSPLSSKSTNYSYDEEPFHQVGTNYTKINPSAEIQLLRKSSVTDSDIPKSPSSNYTKCSPREEIIKLRRESINNDDDTHPTSPSYKKIDPISEIQELRKSHKFNENQESGPPSSVYKKINPAEEIKNLKSKSDSNFNEPSVPVSNYKKVNPAEEIMSAKINSDSSRNVEVTGNYKKINPTEEILSAKNNHSTSKDFETKPIQRINSASEQKSARNSFEKIHKAKEDTHKHNSPQSNIIKFKETPKINNDSPNKQTESGNKILNRESINQPLSPKKVEISGNSKTAKAIFDYEATDSDEIGFLVDDIITDIEFVDEGWWVGHTKDGRKGMFPSNYVEVITSGDEPVIEKYDDNKTTTINPSENKTVDSLTAIAIYDYDSIQDDEISFKEGDYIYNINQMDEGWWTGETKNGANGMFPSNYVKIL